jgi:hypothetical protein
MPDAILAANDELPSRFKVENLRRRHHRRKPRNVRIANTSAQDFSWQFRLRLANQPPRRYLEPGAAATGSYGHLPNRHLTLARPIGTRSGSDG